MGSGLSRSAGPEPGEAEFLGVEGLGAHDVVAREGRHQQPPELVSAVDLQGLRRRVDEPRVADALAVLDRELLLPVDAKRRWRQHLAHPVGRQGEVVALVEEPLPGRARCATRRGPESTRRGGVRRAARAQ